MKFEDIAEGIATLNPDGFFNSLAFSALMAQRQCSGAFQQNCKRMDNKTEGLLTQGGGQANCYSAMLVKGEGRTKICLKDTGPKKMVCRM